MRHVLIMAGGSGKRLWPLSRQDMPKQLLRILGGKSLLRLAYDRLDGLVGPEQVWVCTGTDYAHVVAEELPELPPENILGEPEGRDSLNAIAWTAAVLAASDPDAVMAVVASDQIMRPTSTFQRALREGFEVAEADEHALVTFGVVPTTPHTGYGYLHWGEGLPDHPDVRRVLAFKEKPDRTTAEGYLDSGEYWWNSGMFIWTANRAMAEFELQQPAMYAAMQRIATAVDTPAYDAVLSETWELMPKISLDYAVMEHAEGIAVIPVDIGWSDVGSWDALFDVLNLDEDGNGFKGAGPDHVTLDTRNTLVYSDKLTVTIGLEDLVIVDTSDVLLVCHRDRAQDVKQIVNMLKDRDGGAYL